jgi:hypothetical protein
MPYVPHTRLTFGGTLGSGAVKEAWSCGLQVGGEGTDAVLTIPAGALTACASAVQAWFIRAASGIHSSARIEFLKLAVVDATGHYPAGTQSQVATLGANGASGGDGHPFQIAQVVSLNTALRGPSGRGRFYSPLPAGVVDSDGLVTAAQAAGVASSAAQLLSAINAAFPDSARVVVASSKGFNSTVTSVRVGRALDTVRSRRTGVGENYSPNAAVTG